MRRYTSSFLLNKVRLQRYLLPSHRSVLNATRRKGFDSSNKPESEAHISPSSSSSNKKISKSLAEWASKSPTTTTTTTTTSIDTTSKSDKEEDSSSTTFTTFTKNKENTDSSKNNDVFISRRGGRQRSTRLIVATEATQVQVTVVSIVQTIQNILNENNFNVSTLLTEIQQLIRCTTSTSSIVGPTYGGGLKSFFIQSPTVRQYKLAWVRSDDCLTYIGTGLHKVPLARLEDAFLTLGPKRSWILYEVIRILGPFPNVRNTLNGKVVDIVPKTRSSSPTKSGSSSMSSTSSGGWDLSVQYNSMIDGTGREILAGKAENVRNIKLDILFADENALVCIMPRTSMDTTDTRTIDENSNILLFLKEDDLDARLKALRVSN